MRHVLLALAILPTLVIIVSALVPFASASAADGYPAYPPMRPLRVAILDSDALPGYATGTFYNEYELAYEALSSDPLLDVMVLTSDGIDFGLLDSYDIDVLVLIDNLPYEYANDEIKTWWENRGAIVAFDSSICFLCYVGILPAASAGSNGEGVYWEYSVGDTVTISNPTHPIARGYSGDLYWFWGGTAGYFENVLSGEPEWGHITVVARDAADSNLIAITAYDPPDKGRVAHIWLDVASDIPYYVPFFPNVLNNAVKWAGKLVMTMDVSVSNPTPMQGDTVEFRVRVADERGYILAGAEVWGTALGEPINFHLVPAPLFIFVGLLDTSSLLGDVVVHIYAYFEGLGTLHAQVHIAVTGRFIVDARLDDATPTRGDVIRAYIRVEDYGHRPVEDATVTIIVGTSTIIADHVSDGLYVADIDTSGLSGSVSATIRVEKAGFETKEVPLTFEVEPPPPPPTYPTPTLVPIEYVDLIALAGVGLAFIGLIIGVIAFAKK